MNVKSKDVLFTKETDTWFKGLAVIIVILSHYAEWWAWFFTEEGTTEMIRLGLSRLGPYGVAVFLLFSGYGLAKSAGNKRIGSGFVLKRVFGVYLPYLVVVLLIELFSGGFETAGDAISLLYGHDFWYMTVLFSFYIAFMVIWRFFEKCYIRAALLVGFTVCYSGYLYFAREYDFWYISNAAFALGALLALYESRIKTVIDKICLPGSVLSGITLIVGVCATFHAGLTRTDSVLAVLIRMAAVFLFTVFIVFVADMWNWNEPFGKVLGKYSLYFYLIHTFLFMWTVNHVSYEMPVRFVLAAFITLIFSVGTGIVVSKLVTVFSHKVENIVDFDRGNS